MSDREICVKAEFPPIKVFGHRLYYIWHARYKGADETEPCGEGETPEEAVNDLIENTV